MELYDKLKNITGKNNEEELVKSIAVVRDTLNGLVEERMCKVYSSFLLNELRKRHVPCRLINTSDLGLDYEHVFVLVPHNDNGYFLSDLTFSQFSSNKEELEQLLVNGYQLMNDQSLKCYLDVISKRNLVDNVSLDEVFYSSK